MATTNNKPAVSIEEPDYEETMLTTIDNPFNPFTQYEKWTAFDEIKGYNTSAYLARCVDVEEDTFPVDVSLLVEQAIEEILFYNLTGKYCKIKRNGELILND